MSFRVILLCAISIALVGCGKPSPPQAASTTAPKAGQIPPESSEAALAATLAELTQTLRKYSVEQRRVPASLNELVAAGYIKDLPQPPPGKSFGVDSKKLQVVLK